MLSKNEIERYARHFPLPDFGMAGQEKLKSVRVLVVGCGGLGNPVSQYLSAAGVGHLGLLDNDKVAIGNLQRQVLYNQNLLGNGKANSAKKILSALNSEIEITAIDKRLTADNALEILRDWDLIIDCSDNFPTRYLLNDACVLLDKTLIYGSIYQYEGQVSVFNVDKSANYRDLFPLPPDPASVPNCEVGGVLGSLAGIIGSIQANEAMKIICNIGEPLVEKLFIFDSLTSQSKVIKYRSKQTRDQITELIDYEEFCSNSTKKMVKEVTVKELHDMMENKEDFQLIDVREPHEADISTLNGDLIPLGQVPDNEDKIATDKKVVVHCRSGARSGQAIQYLEKKLGLDNLYNLRGGILAWADEIDPSMAKY